jgi:hypothetical protein
MTKLSLYLVALSDSRGPHGLVGEIFRQSILLKISCLNIAHANAVTLWCTIKVSRQCIVWSEKNSTKDQDQKIRARQSSNSILVLILVRMYICTCALGNPNSVIELLHTLGYCARFRRPINTYCQFTRSHTTLFARLVGQRFRYRELGTDHHYRTYLFHAIFQNQVSGWHKWRDKCRVVAHY